MRVAAAFALLASMLAASLPLERRLRGDPAPDAPPEELGLSRLAGGVLTGAFRPLLLDYLWLRADSLDRLGRLDELRGLYRRMSLLYPGNEPALEFIGAHLAFALKSDMPDPGSAWNVARDGLDLLARVRDGRRTIALWFFLQCGQSPADGLRYAGAGWAEERALRARAGAWYAARFGPALDRFSAALDAIRGLDRFEDRMLRARLLELLASDELVRTGRAEHAEEARRALQESAAMFADAPPIRDGWLQDAQVLEDLVAGRVPRALAAIPDAPLALVARAGAALWGIGMARNDAALLEEAARVFASAGDDAFPEERDALGAWLAHARDPSRPRPPHPFD